MVNIRTWQIPRTYNTRVEPISFKDIEFVQLKSVCCASVQKMSLFGRLLMVFGLWVCVCDLYLSESNSNFRVVSDENQIQGIYSNIECGSSRNFWKCCSHWAPTAPSTVRWSQLSVTVINSLFLKPFSDVASGTIRCCVPPTARMHDCGGLMTAQKWVTPKGQIWWNTSWLCCC